MTAAEYLERIKQAPTAEDAYAVTREAIVDAREKRISVDEWNAIWIAYDERSQPWRYRDGNWTGD